jgi:hypothetical protein
VAGREAAAAGRPVPASAARAPIGGKWVAAGSLAGLIGLPEPQDAPLLHPLPELLAAWRGRLAALPGKGPLIGLCWRTSLASGRRDRLQAAPEHLAPLLALPDARFISLQIGARPAELATLDRLAGRPIARFDDLDIAHDLEQAIALAAALDLVVSVGTWIAPLAGAVGTPVAYLAALRDYWTLGGDTIAWCGRSRVYPATHGYDAACRALAADIALGNLPQRNLP